MGRGTVHGWGGACRIAPGVGQLSLQATNGPTQQCPHTDPGDTLQAAVGWKREVPWVANPTRPICGGTVERDAPRQRSACWDPELPTSGTLSSSTARIPNRPARFVPQRGLCHAVLLSDARMLFSVWHRGRPDAVFRTVNNDRTERGLCTTVSAADVCGPGLEGRNDYWTGFLTSLPRNRAEVIPVHDCRWDLERENDGRANFDSRAFQVASRFQLKPRCHSSPCSFLCHPVG